MGKGSEAVGLVGISTQSVQWCLLVSYKFNPTSKKLPESEINNVFMSYDPKSCFTVASQCYGKDDPDQLAWDQMSRRHLVIHSWLTQAISCTEVFAVSVLSHSPLSIPLPKCAIKDLFHPLCLLLRYVSIPWHVLTFVLTRPFWNKPIY